MHSKNLTVLLFFIPMQISLCFGETHQSIKLAIDPWYPWVMADKPVPHGIAVDIITELYQRIGVPIEIDVYPFKRVIANLKQGKVDGSWLITKSKEREKFATFSSPLLSDSYYVYSRVDSPFKWQTWEDLKGLQIGVTSGFYYGDEFHQANQKYQYRLFEVTTDLQLVKMLLSERVDLILLNQTVAKALQRDHHEFNGKLFAASKPITKIIFYVLFSKKSPARRLIPKINKTIKQMKQDGSIERILSQSK